MLRHCLGNATAVARRAIPLLRLASALTLATLGSAAPAGRAAEPAEPVARLQLVVKQVTIHDDREGILSGEGEMELYAGVWRCEEGIPPPCAGYAEGASRTLETRTFSGTGGPIVRAGKLLGGSTGETVTLDREVPQAGDVMWGGNTSPELGFAIYAGQHYVVQFEMVESDGNDCAFNCDEYMGYAFHVLDTGEHGLGLGTHTARSRREDGVSAGDYTVTYEVRRTPLPDLEPVNIRVHDLPGSADKRVCMAVLNREVVHAGPFEVALRVGKDVPPDGRYMVGLLAPGTDYLACVETALPTSGQHVLAAVVDAPRAVTEFNEANNVYEQLYTAPAPTPGPAQADLTVSAIRVNGRAPDGKDDCKDGKNDVTVVVKNAGPAHAASLAVRLDVDGQERDEALLSGLVAGQEQEVRFEGVRLSKGQRTLVAVTDPNKAVAEPKEDNNQLKVTAACRDDD